MVKVISLSDEAYAKLRSFKRNKSFSQVIIELAGNEQRSILDFAGVFSGNKKEWGKIKGMIYRDRKKSKLREVSF